MAFSHLNYAASFQLPSALFSGGSNAGGGNSASATFNNIFHNTYQTGTSSTAVNATVGTVLSDISTNNAGNNTNSTSLFPNLYHPASLFAATADHSSTANGIRAITGGGESGEASSGSPLGLIAGSSWIIPPGTGGRPDLSISVSNVLTSMNIVNTGTTTTAGLEPSPSTAELLSSGEQRTSEGSPLQHGKQLLDLPTAPGNVSDSNTLTAGMSHISPVPHDLAPPGITAGLGAMSGFGYPHPLMWPGAPGANGLAGFGVPPVTSGLLPATGNSAFSTTNSSFYGYENGLSMYPWGGQIGSYGGSANPHLDLSGARRKNATRESTNVLKSWLQEHINNPYPSKGEKIMLAIITRMNLTQVSTWFANARRRLKKENRVTWSPRNQGVHGESKEAKDDNDEDEDEDEEDGDGDGNASENDYQVTRDMKPVTRQGRDMKQVENMNSEDRKPVKLVVDSVGGQHQSLIEEGNVTPHPPWLLPSQQHAQLLQHSDQTSLHLQQQQEALLDHLQLHHQHHSQHPMHHGMEQIFAHPSSPHKLLHPSNNTSLSSCALTTTPTSTECAGSTNCVFPPYSQQSSALNQPPVSAFSPSTMNPYTSAIFPPLPGMNFADIPSRGQHQTTLESGLPSSFLFPASSIAGSHTPTAAAVGNPFSAGYATLPSAFLSSTGDGHPYSLLNPSAAAAAATLIPGSAFQAGHSCSTIPHSASMFMGAAAVAAAAAGNLSANSFMVASTSLPSAANPS